MRKRAIAALSAVALLAFSGVAISAAVAWFSPVEAPTVDVPLQRGDSSLSVLWVGDTMLGDAAQDNLEKLGYRWVFDLVRGQIDADFTVANAEGPITTRSEPWNPSQHWHYNAQPQAARAMADAGIRAVNLANNHGMDRGPQGLADTMANSRAAGIRTFGAGADLEEAEKPLLVRSGVGTIGIVGLGKYYGPTNMAGPAQPGTIALSRASIRRGYDLARKAGADWVVGFVHWGRSYSPVTQEQRDFAREFAQAGYSLVVGTHPHIVQPIEVIDGMPVLYSVGNFVFGAPGRFTPEFPGVGLIVGTEFTAQGLTTLSLRCIATDNKVVAYQARPCGEEQARSVLTSLHPDVVMEGKALATLPFAQAR